MSAKIVDNKWYKQIVSVSAIYFIDCVRELNRSVNDNHFRCAASPFDCRIFALRLGTGLLLSNTAVGPIAVEEIRPLENGL